MSTKVPKNEYSTEKLMEVFPGDIPEGVKANILNLGVSKRYLVSHTDLPLKSREAVLEENELLDLCSEVCQKAVEKADLSIKDIDYFITSYDASPFLCPSLSQLLIRKVGLKPHVRYANVQGVACGAFAKSLELAQNYLAAHPRDTVLVCISGVNSYWFQNQVRGIKNLMEISQINSLKNQGKRRMELRKWVATMEFFLFGDGVASLILKNDGKGLSVRKIAEVTNLDSRDYLAGYARLAATNEPFRFGFYSHLDKEIPNLGGKYTSVVLENLLGKNVEKTMKNVKKWVIHTGSGKILNVLAEKHKIPREKIEESHKILREYGNLAGASIPFILEEVVSKNVLSHGDYVLTVGYGWGFSASACLLECNV
ncbi:MAG: 3-oxoacyl-[acyl-carrier-protein] synthase III C-terminal domain-containing protein [Candidatus Bathyarchaeia archaeon]